MKLERLGMFNSVHQIQATFARSNAIVSIVPRLSSCLCAISIFLVLAQPAFAQDAPNSSSTEPLTRAEFIRQMDIEFSRYDRNGDRVVTIEDIRAAQQQAATGLALRKNREIFVQLDADRNGQLSAEEFAALVSTENLVVDPNPLMNQFDTDKDGVITLVEYRVATQSNFDRVDTDRDGVITQTEIRAAGILQ